MIIQDNKLHKIDVDFTPVASGQPESEADVRLTSFHRKNHYAEWTTGIVDMDPATALKLARAILDYYGSETVVKPELSNAFSLGRDETMKLVKIVLENTGHTDPAIKEKLASLVIMSPWDTYS